MVVKLKRVKRRNLEDAAQLEDSIKAKKKKKKLGPRFAVKLGTMSICWILFSRG
jgi:hypothetical protein